MVQKLKIKNQVACKTHALYEGDCCKILPQLPDEFVGFSVFSPPFCSLYSYSDSDEDMGNVKSNEEFFDHFGFLVKELFRVTMPGRSVAVHCMDLPTHKSKGEEIGTYDFPADINACFLKNGFIRHCRIVIWKDPLIAATRTHAVGLAHQQLVKDSAISRVGIPDQILVFRKPGENPKPIPHPEGLTEYPGMTPIPKDLDKWIDSKDTAKNKRSHWIWQRIASPVWFDINQVDVLPFVKARDKDDQRHICPLQRQTIQRCLILWSAPGDIVLTPFMGVGSEVYEAVRMGRRGVGVELKPSYFRQAVKNLESLKTKQKARAMSNGKE